MINLPVCPLALLKQWNIFRWKLHYNIIFCFFKSWNHAKKWMSYFIFSEMLLYLPIKKGKLSQELVNEWTPCDAYTWLELWSWLLYNINILPFYLTFYGYLKDAVYIAPSLLGYSSRKWMAKVNSEVRTVLENKS